MKNDKINKKLVNAIKNSVLSLHKESRKYHKRKSSLKSNIKYGRSPSLSTYFEETFAQELSKLYPNYIFYIDHPVRLYDKRDKALSSQNIYPDLMISTKDNTLKAIIELKTDIGHLDIENLKKSKREKDLLKAKSGKINEVVGRYSDQKYDTEKITLDFSKKYKKILIVITLVNQHSYGSNPKSKEYRKVLKTFRYSPLFLLEKCHYNYFDDKTNQITDEIISKSNEIIKAFGEL